MNQAVFEKVRDIIIDKLNVNPEQVTPEARFREDLKADSLDLVELIMAFEEEFGGTISDEDAQKITSVGDAVSHLQKASGA
jgi:acyl carrier protein